MANCIKCNKKFTCGCQIVNVNGKKYCATCAQLAKQLNK